MATAMSVTSEDFINNKCSEDELEVADILVDMRRLMTRFVSCYSFKYNWIFKKKRRSALVSPRKRKFITPLCKEEASSPNTPFCFSVSESDSNPDKTSTPLLLSQKELKKTLKEKNKAQHQIKKSIGRVQKSLDPIMAENSVLKAKKWELQMDGEEKEKMKDNMTACNTLQVQQTNSTPLIHPHYHIDGVNDSSASTSSQFENQPPPWIHPYRHQHGATLGNDPMCAGPSSSTLFHHHHQPLILHLPYPMLQNHPSQQQQQQQQQREVARVQIELNVSASVDDERMMMNGNMIIKRAQAQQARKNRKRVITQKKTRGRS